MNYGIYHHSYLRKVTGKAITNMGSIDMFEPQSRGVWETVTKYAKCIAGTAGSAGLGILSGAAVGTVTLPIIGTVSGATLGGYSGALVGAATFC